MRTFFEAGLALMVIFAPVNGFTPSRALVAGFFTTRILQTPGRVKTPAPFNAFFITPFSASNTATTCFFVRSVWSAIVETICDLVSYNFV